MKVVEYTWRLGVFTVYGSTLKRVFMLLGNFFFWKKKTCFFSSEV